MKEKKIETTINVYKFNELPENDQQLIKAAKEATSRSYAPYSKFCVGAAIRLENNEVVTGTNQENAAYPSGLCAERTAMFYANSTFPNVAPTTLAIACKIESGFLESPLSPCGACRQVLLESESRYNQPIRVLLYGENGVYELENVRKLLPLAFDNADGFF